jgi:L,D-transpeptidase YbiS
VKLSPLQSICLILLAVLVMAWAELYMPFRESFRLDVVELAVQVYRTRNETTALRRELPRLGQELADLTRQLQDVSRRVASAFSNELYLVVNPATNRLAMRRGQEVLLEAPISTGSNDSLSRRGRKWVFRTPRGVMTVLRKKKDPVWLKPDWAFLEKGEPVPAWNSPLRREKGVLGDYLLDLGGGVMIHGTPMEHLLGQSVTHGCIRVGKDDLRVLYDSVPVGAKVYIF